MRADGDVCPCFKKKHVLHLALKEAMITANLRALLSLWPTILLSLQCSNVHEIENREGRKSILTNQK
jgi:hypothetical protein